MQVDQIWFCRVWCAVCCTVCVIPKLEFEIHGSWESFVELLVVKKYLLNTFNLTFQFKG
jgi:hypothetical protein